MSGILVIWHFDGQPLDRRLLRDLTAAMASSGPDGTRHHVDGVVGLGFAKLATTDEAEREQQPLSLDGEVWIAADARIDGRRELLAELAARGAEVRGEATDPELILHAYRVWGEEAAAHLLGDFCFAIWDRRHQLLFCARDHFGIKPLYYAEVAGGVAVSNVLSCLRQHPAVSSELNEQAIADYLLFESNCDPQTTTFADIQRLPPAHTLSWTPGGRKLRRYWDFPTATPSPPAEPAGGWVERFRALLRTAVEDRLRTGSVAVWMSGGLDSPAVAATASEIYAEQGRHDRVWSYTLGYERLIPDREGHYAEMVAQHLALRHSYRPVDDHNLGESRRWLPPEPYDQLANAVGDDLDRAIARQHRVGLTGYGADPLLSSSRGYLLEQLGRGRFGTAVRYLGGSLRRTGRLPPLGLHSHWQRWVRKRRWRNGYPDWLDVGFEARCGLESKWRQRCFERGPEALHPRRPEAHRMLVNIFWSNLFEQLAPGFRSIALEARHPFFDLRLVEALLELPPVPWCLDKHLLREAMRGILPEPVRLRPKAPLAGSPKHPSKHRQSREWQRLARRVPAVSRFVHPNKVLEELRHFEDAGEAAPPLDSEIFRALSLGSWLEHLDQEV